MDSKVRVNKIKVGETFTKSEPIYGTSTYKCVETLVDTKDINGKCTMVAELIKTTKNELKQSVGQTRTVIFFKNRRGQYPNIKVKTEKNDNKKNLGKDIFGNDIDLIFGITELKSR